METLEVQQLDARRLEFLPILEKWSDGYFNNYSNPAKKKEFDILRHAGFEKLGMINKRLCELQNITCMYEHPKYAQ